MNSCFSRLLLTNVLLIVLSPLASAQSASPSGNLALGGDSAGATGILRINFTDAIEGPLSVTVRDSTGTYVAQPVAQPLSLPLGRHRSSATIAIVLASAGQTTIAVTDGANAAETVSATWNLGQFYPVPAVSATRTFAPSTVVASPNASLWAQADRVENNPDWASLKVHVDNSHGSYDVEVRNAAGSVIDHHLYDLPRGGGTEWSTQVKLDRGANTIRVSIPGSSEVATINVPAMTASFSSSEAMNQDPPEYDWGRVRGYFSSGVILSKERDDFSKTDIFLDFTLDKTYLAHPFGPFKNINTFFDARLTSIPVTAAPEPSASPSPAATSETTCNTADCDSFITSRKAAMMQAGIYFPMYWNFTTWNRKVPRLGRSARTETNALFIAPLAKGGILTTTGQQTAEARQFGSDDVFNFYSFGGMLGHFRLHGRWRSRNFEPDQDVAPELISWLAITYGRWENFEIETPSGQKDAAGNDIPWRRRPYRWEALGRLKIPETPFIIGFDGNFGKGPDDVRFLFGTRFDIGKILHTLKVASALDTLGQTPAP